MGTNVNSYIEWPYQIFDLKIVYCVADWFFRSKLITSNANIALHCFCLRSGYYPDYTITVHVNNTNILRELNSKLLLHIRLNMH